MADQDFFVELFPYRLSRTLVRGGLARGLLVTVTMERRGVIRILFQPLLFTTSKQVMRYFQQGKAT